MAYRMQISVPELTDVSTEPASTFELCGEDARKPGTSAYKALIARRLSERGVRQLGVDHARLTFKFQGRYYRLTDVSGTVVKPLLA